MEEDGENALSSYQIQKNLKYLKENKKSYLYPMISRQKTKKKTLCFLKDSRAFSLIEVLIVVLIIAFVFTFVSRSIVRRGQTVKKNF